MNYVINSEEISIILYFLKCLFIHISTYYIFLKLINKEKSKLFNLSILIMIIITTIGYVIIKEQINPMDSIILLILVLTAIFSRLNKNAIGYTIVTTIFSLSISNILFFLSTVLNCWPNIILNIHNDGLAFLFISVIYFLLVFLFIKIKRLKNGLSFFHKKSQSELFDVLILNISAMTLFSIEIFGNYDILMVGRLGVCIIILSIIMFITVKKSFQVYYKQKLLIQELETTKTELINKENEIQKLEQENLNFGKKSHTLSHRQRILKYKLDELSLKTEMADEISIREDLNDISKELYNNSVTVELTKTGIEKLDDILKYMQFRCIENKIDFNLQIIGNIYHMINNIITKEELEILIADHVEDAIIAINHTDNINRSILVKLGKIEECYGLYIYDSGIEFEKETLENLGKKPITTHSSEGGTGMGFMNTFDTLRRNKASLIIKELGKPSKENYTKIIMFKFDDKNEFKVI